MGFIIGLFTVAMVLDCALLIFLVLIQLPKKEAGAGLAFGAGATDALFGAGSGTVLTKITKYSATIFFVLAILVAIMQRNYNNRRATSFGESLSKQPTRSAPGAMSPGPAEPPTPAIPAPSTQGTNAGLLSAPAITNTVITTNLPAETVPQK